MTEEKALRELQNRSETALEWFIEAYTPYVTTVIHNILGSNMDMADVEEVAADVFGLEAPLWDTLAYLAPAVSAAAGVIYYIAKKVKKTNAKTA